MREAYLRASLGEYVSMEETAKRDFALLGLGQTPPMMGDSENPLVHACRELRNLNFHLASSRIAEDSKPAIWHFDGKDHQLDYSLTLVEGFTVGQFMSLRNAKYYHPKDVQSLVEWFNNEQREWGAPHLLVLAISHYASELLARVPRAA